MALIYYINCSGITFSYVWTKALSDMFKHRPVQQALFFFFKAALGEHVKGREGAWSKGPSLPYSLVVCRMSVAEKASWELVCHLNLLLSTGIQVFFYNTGGAWQRLKNYFNSACKKFFHFWKALSCLFWGGGRVRCLGSVINWIWRNCNFSVICYGMRGSELSLQALSLLPQG